MITLSLNALTCVVIVVIVRCKRAKPFSSVIFFESFHSRSRASSARQRQYTDFAKGCGVFAEPNKGYEKYTDWWLRDRVENKIDCNFYVNTLGDITEYEHVIVSLVGIVPAIVISEK